MSSPLRRVTSVTRSVGLPRASTLVALDRAALKARQIEAEAVARAEEVAAEKELDPIALSEIVSEMLHGAPMPMASWTPLGAPRGGDEGAGRSGCCCRRR